MAIKRFLRRWLQEVALLLVLALIALGLVFVRTVQQRSATPNAPVVYGESLLAVHNGAAPGLAAPGMAAPGLAAPGMAATPEGKAAAQANQGTPRLELSSSFYDFGILRTLAAVSRDFFIINRGSAALVIQRAYTTCACTTAELSASVAPPGTAVRVTMMFNPDIQNLFGQTIRRGLILDTNDPDQPEVSIWIQASLR